MIEKRKTQRSAYRLPNDHQMICRTSNNHTLKLSPALSSRCNNQHNLFLSFFQPEDGIRRFHVTGVQTCALPISSGGAAAIAASAFPEETAGASGPPALQ